MLAEQWLVIAGVLSIALSDVMSRRIPNTFSLCACSGGLIYLACAGHAVMGGSGLDILLGLLLAALLTIPAYLQHKLGAADAKLMLAIAVLGGWKAVLFSFVVAGLLGGISLMAMLQYSAYSTRPMPTGRWLPFGALLAIGFIASVGVQW